MTGSLHDTEDLVQETLLRAWKGYDRFERKSYMRTWLYRVLDVVHGKAGGALSHVVAFLDRALFAKFGLPDSL